jgi:hypothetical protein
VYAALAREYGWSHAYVDGLTADQIELFLHLGAVDEERRFERAAQHIIGLLAKALNGR